MNRPPPTTERARAAFTLVELLATMAIFTLIVLALVTMVSNISSSWTRSRQRMDNFTKARALLSTLDHDLGNAVIRQDLPAFSDSSQTGPISFFTREFGQTSYDANGRALTYVSYTRQVVRTDANGQSLPQPRRLFERMSHPYSFGDSLDWRNAFNFDNTAPTMSFTQAQTGQLCEGVYGVVSRFINVDGSFSATFNPPATNPTSSSRALQISLLILGEQADQLAASTGRSDQLESDFAAVVPAVTSATTAKTAWDQLLTTQMKYPSVILSGISTYERIVPLNPSAASFSHLTPTSSPSY